VLLAEASIVPVFGSRYQDAVDNAISTTTSDAFQQKLRLSVRSVPAGRYRLDVSYMWNHDATDSDFEARVQQNDAVDLYLHKEEPKDSSGIFGATGTSQRHPAHKTIILDLATGSHDFDLDYRSDFPGVESSIWDAVLSFWRIQ
jgi:hypothetical protein